MHRDCLGVRSFPVLSGLLVVVTLAAAPAPCGAGCGVLRGGFTEPNVVAPYAELLGAPEAKHVAGVFTAVENPYLIEGLISSSLLAGLRSGSRSIWIEWSRLGHEIYQEDHAAVLLGFGLIAEGLRGSVIPGVERRAVKGFSARYGRSLRCAASYEFRMVSIAFEGSAYESDPAAPREAVLRLAFRSKSLAVAADRFCSGALEGSTDVAVAVRLHESCSCISTYRSGTAEVSGGLLVAVARLAVHCAWRQHPVLGSTVAMEVGRVWKW